MQIRSLLCLSILLLNCVWSNVTEAQNAQVQQPVVDVFRVDTTVSVPDRGSEFLGGVSSARDGRSAYGPVPLGTSSGRALSNSAMHTHVYIHDFEWLDLQLLIEAERTFGAGQQFKNESSRQHKALQVLKHENPASSPQMQSVPDDRVHSEPYKPMHRREQALEILRRSR